MAKLFLFNLTPLTGGATGQFRAEFFINLTPEQVADLMLRMDLIDFSINVVPSPRVRNLP